MILNKEAVFYIPEEQMTKTLDYSSISTTYDGVLERLQMPIERVKHLGWEIIKVTIICKPFND